MTTVVCSPTLTVRFVHRLLFVLIAMCGFAAAASAQTTVTLSTPGTHINVDTTIEAGASGMTDFGTSTVLASKASSGAYDRRIMLKFDTQNYIPANTVIQSARLYLVLKTAESGEQRPLTAFHVSKSFADRQVNWYYYRDGQQWNTPGGDLDVRFGTTLVGNAVGSAYTFDLTQMVQRVVNGEFGSRYTRVALVDTGADNTGDYRAFHSTRATDTALRPRLVITYGKAASAPPPSPQATGGTLRVMQWNIHKTKGSDGRCDPDRTANAIVAQSPDVISLNEVNFFAGVCAWNFDMGEKLQTLIQQKTGVRWYIQSVNPNGVGNVILSRLPPVSSSTKLLDNGRGVAQMGIVVNGRTVNVFSTHVEYDVASWRPIQIAEAVKWLTSFPEPRIIMGDFNTNPGTTDYNIIGTIYRDAWAMANSAGTATSYNGTGATHGTSRFDYAFYLDVTLLSIGKVKVPDTHVGSIAVSDHDPVVAVFSVK
jgi:endonuclease/exonuclease/phosphatase family metal-dependent hydrolase